MFTRAYDTVLPHTRFEKSLDDPQQPGIGNAVCQKALQVVVTDVVKEAFDVRLHNPLRALQRDDFRQSLQRLMRIPLRAKSIRALPKLRLPDRLQNPTQAILHESIFKAGHGDFILHLAQQAFEHWAAFAFYMNDLRGREDPVA